MPHRLNPLSVAISLCLVSTATLATPIAPSQPVQLQADKVQLVGQGDYKCQGRLFGKWALLWLKGDKPVQYKWSSRGARKAEMKGNTIYIEADPTATISNVVMGTDSKGNKVIKGDFKFKSNTKDGLTFTCKPE